MLKIRQLQHHCQTENICSAWGREGRVGWTQNRKFPPKNNCVAGYGLNTGKAGISAVSLGQQLRGSFTLQPQLLFQFPDASELESALRARQNVQNLT